MWEISGGKKQQTNDIAQQYVITHNFGGDNELNFIICEGLNGITT